MTGVNGGLDLNALSILGDVDLVTKVALQSIDLKVVLEELLESGGIEDLVIGRLLAVNDELYAKPINISSIPIYRGILFKTYLSLDRGSLLVCLFEKKYNLAYCITP